MTRYPIAILAVVGALVLAQCGGGGTATPTPSPTGLFLGLTASADVGPHAWDGTPFEQGADGAANARVTPASLYLEVRAAITCVSGAGEPIAASASGSLELTLPRGQYCARVGNPTDQTVHYSVEVHYTTAR